MLTRIRLYALARVLFPCHHSLVLICLWLPWLRWLKFHLVFPCFFKAYGFPPKLKTEVAKMVGCMLFATLFSESYTHMEKSNGHLVVFHQKFFPLTLLLFFLKYFWRFQAAQTWYLSCDWLREISGRLKILLRYINTDVPTILYVNTVFGMQ